MPGGIVRLDPSRGPSLRLILNAAPERSGGVGGWEETERTARRPTQWWKSLPGETMSLDCTLDLDAIPSGLSIERRLRILKAMGMHDEGDDPPTIKVTGDIWSADRALTWVMTNWSFGERLYQPDGTLRRQAVTIDLARYIDVADIKPLRIKSTRTKGKKRRTRTIVSRKGETLRACALRALGSASRWKDLKKWNKKLKKIDPDLRLRPGTHIKIRG